MMEPTPLRPDDQVAGGFLAMRLGGQDYEVKILPMRDSRKWLVHAKAMVAKMKGTAEGLESFEGIVDFLAGQSEAMMDALIAWDALGDKALPEREWIDTHATDGEVYAAWKRVGAAMSPLAQEALHIVPDLMPLLIDAFRKAVTKGTAVAMIAMASSKSTSGSRPSTGGAPTTSTPTSPTSSSPSTLRKRRSAASKPPSPS